MREFGVSEERVGVSSLQGNKLLLGDKTGTIYFYDI